MELHVDIRKNLAANGRRFQLSVTFESSSRNVLLFGPSGSGKTLTLSALAGLLRPDSGLIRIGGRVFFDSENGIHLPSRRRRIGLVFQDYALFPHLRVEENVAFGLYCGWPFRLGRQNRLKVARTLERLEIGELARSFPAELSGGQRQRVALARALAGDPELLLLDEPFAALDCTLRGRLRAQMRETCREFDVPIVMISHDPIDIHFFADTLIRLDRGCVREVRSILRRAEGSGLHLAESSWGEAPAVVVS
jgi:molybdate transport system ATP-binding protein